MTFPDYPNAGELAGVDFVKGDVYHALRMKTSQTAIDANLFSATYLRNLPKLEEWFNDPKGKYEAKFAHMTVKRFQEWCHKGMENSSKKSKREDEYDGEEGRSKGKGKRKATYSDSESDDRRSRKSKSSRRISSEDLDSD